MKFISKLFFRLILGVFALLLILLLLISLVLFVPSVQEYISHNASTYLSDKIGTQVSLNAIYLDFPNKISIEDIYIEDQKKDTLLYSENFEISIDYLALLHAEVEVSHIILENSTTSIKVREDSSYNFDFILNSFQNTNEDRDVPDTSKPSTLSFDIGIIEFKNVRFSYLSEPDGILTSYSIGYLKIDVKQFDLENQIYIANQIELTDSKGSFEIFKETNSSNTSTNSGPINLTVGSNELNVSNTSFEFKDKTTETYFLSKIGNFNLTLNPINLKDDSIHLNNLWIQNSEIEFSINSQLTHNSPIASNTKEVSTNPFDFSLNSINLSNLKFKFDDLGEKEKTKGLDYSHLDLTVNALEFEELFFKGPENLRLNLKKLQAKEKSGIIVKEGAFDFKMNSNSLITKNLFLKTNSSTIIASAEMRFESIEKIDQQLGDLEVDLSFSHSVIDLSDALYFMPELDTSELIKPFLNRIVRINGSIIGPINQLQFKEILVETNENTSLGLNGAISGLPNSDSLSFSFQEIKLTTTKSDLTSYLPDSLVPSEINLPNNMVLKSTFNGDLNGFKTNINLESNFGNLFFHLTFQKNDTIDSYQLCINVPQFNLASLLQDTSLNNISFDSDISGKGLNQEEMELEVAATVSNFDYLNYRYSDLNINGLIKKGSFEGGINMTDSNLIFDFEGFANIDSINPQFNFDFSLEGIDLQNLNITKEDYRLNGRVTAELEGNSLKNLNGDIAARDILIIYKGEKYRIDSLLFVSIIDSGKTDISIKSNLFDASFKGNTYLSEIDKALRNYLERKLDSQLAQEVIQPHDFVFDVKIKDTEIITEVLIPQLKSFKTGKIHGEFDNQQDILSIDIDFSKIDYSGLTVDSLIFSIKTKEEQIESNFSIKKISYDTLSIENIAFQSIIKERKANITFKILDAFDERVIQLTGDLTEEKSVFNFHFLKNQQYFNKNVWEVNPNNQIKLGDSTTFDKVEFSSNDQKFSLQTKNDFNNLSFSNFELASIFNNIKSSNQKIKKNASNYEKFNKLDSSSKSTFDSSYSTILNGILSGEINFPSNSKKKLKAELKLDQLLISGEKIGNLNGSYIQLQNKDSMSIYLDGENNKLELSGFLTDNGLNLNLEIEKLQMKTIEIFSRGQIMNSEGFITASADLLKEGETYDSKGIINFQNIRVRSFFLGETFYLDNESLNFSRENVVFQKFTILDSSKNPFLIGGNIGIKSLTNPTFDLKVKIDHFKFLNTSKESANDLFYGTVISSVDLDITGDFNRPKIESTINLEEGTDLTFIAPEGEANEVSRDGIVEFIDKDEKISLLIMKEKESNISKVDIHGIDFSSIINIDNNTKLTIVIDPISGDRLKIQGGGEIRADIGPTGRIELNGIYTIKNGDYELKLYNIIQRKFSLNEGSNLIWNGSPLKAKMDITGSYITKASPIGLLESQTSDLSEAERTTYKKRIPFEVLLFLEGELLKPEISFKIELSDDQKSVIDGAISNKLAQLNENESELNKQVFSLIILKRFYTTDIFGDGGGGSYAARESVSQILSQQLNNLSEKYVKGFEMEVNVDSYNDFNSNGDLDGNTDLNLAMSKTLFEDRVVVRVDGDFALEDNNNTQASNKNAVSGNVSIEYKITEDGKYKLKGFRQDGYDGISGGEFIETGISIIYTKEFKRLRDIFNPSKELTKPK